MEPRRAAKTALSKRFMNSSFVQKRADLGRASLGDDLITGNRPSAE